MGWGFLGIGGAFVLVAVLEGVLGFDYFNASPIRVALFLIAIGGALLWTVRRRPDDIDADGPDPETDATPAPDSEGDERP
jgi:hypothetical protein